MNGDKSNFSVAIALKVFQLKQQIQANVHEEDEYFEATKNYVEPFEVYDMASRNVVLAVWATRCEKPRAPSEVGLAFSSDNPVFAAEAGVRTLVLVILLQAYRKKASMKVIFRGPRDGKLATPATGFEPVIPREIVDYAARLGVLFAKDNQIQDHEGRKLFIRLTFTKKERQQITALGLNPLIVAFVMNRGTWTKNELYAILNFCAYPRVPLCGEINGSFGRPYNAVQSVLRRSLLAERIISDLCMEIGETGFGNDVVEYSWVDQYRIRVVASVDFNMAGFLGGNLTIKAGKPFMVGVMPMLTGEYEFHFLMPNALSRFKDVACLYVTQDFRRVSQRGQQGIATFGHPVRMAKVTTESLELANLKKMRQSANLSIEMESVANG